MGYLSSPARKVLSICVAVLALTAMAAPLQAQKGPSQYASSTEGVMARSTIKGDPVAACGHLGYVVNSYSATASVIDLSKNAFVKNLPLGEKPINPTFTRDWTKLYVANSGAGTLTIIDAKTVQVIGTIPAGVPTPRACASCPTASTW